MKPADPIVVEVAPLTERIPFAFTGEERKCGDCRQCCITLGVPELGKPAHTSCKSICPKGCRVFDTPDRPKSCTTFKCLWLQGFGDKTLRPDKVHVVFVSSQTAVDPELLTAFEGQPNATKRMKIQRFLAPIVKKTLINVVRFEGKNEIDGPDSELQRLRDLSRKVDDGASVVTHKITSPVVVNEP